MWKSVESLWIKPEELDKAVTLLKEGELVAFPTETVYGLGADAKNDQAVQKIYQAKGRPSDNPLIVHIYSVNQVLDFSSRIPSRAQDLIDAFWPGPLTIILNHDQETAAPTVTAGQDSIGIRMPNHPLARDLLKASGLALAAPSANLSGRPSPTSADHVWHDLSGRIAGVLDGGPTGLGLESTVVDFTQPDQPAILRPGGLAREDIERVIGPVQDKTQSKSGDKGPKAPGMKYRHYSPDQPVYIVDNNWTEAIDKCLKSGEKIGILASDDIIENYGDQVYDVFSLGDPKDVARACQVLYKGLRYFDDSPVTLILAQSYTKSGLGWAYMNRLEKAASQ